MVCDNDVFSISQLCKTLLHIQYSMSTAVRHRMLWSCTAVCIVDGPVLYEPLRDSCYKHATYCTLWICNVGSTAQYLLNMITMALLTGKSEVYIFKSGIYFGHPVNSTKYINYELQHLWQYPVNETYIDNFTFLCV